MGILAKCINPSKTLTKNKHYEVTMLREIWSMGQIYVEYDVTKENVDRLQLISDTGQKIMCHPNRFLIT
tara:strand:- start:72463 stop:72669 length:207 start_codon:yes stop_codon:yes gene_type:complete